jgi:hypothetical protein
VCVGTSLIASWCVFPDTSQAAVASAERAYLARICDQAAATAAHDSGVPLDVLRAITRTETGRARDGRLEPWPWTVNMEGKGVWFDDLDAARAYVFRHFKRGARSFDVGCFQINYRWHQQHFQSIDDMFDPEQNAAYAARFLAELYAEFGDWSRAAAAYHSRTPKFADRYRNRFDRIRAALDPLHDPPAPTRPRARFTDPQPLFSTGQARLGSLVPVAPAAGAAGSLAFFAKGQ